MRKFTIYTDGSANNKIPLQNRKGGWAAIIIEEGKELELIVGSELCTSSYRAELMAVISGIYKVWSIVGDKKANILINSDSKSVVDAVKEGWVYEWEKLEFLGKSCVNEWRVFLELIRLPNIQCRLQWVRGHNGNFWNQNADKAANQIRKGKTQKEILHFLRLQNERR